MKDIGGTQVSYIEKTMDFSDEKILKKHIRNCNKYRNLVFLPKIIECKYLWFEMFLMVCIVVFGCSSYMEMNAGTLRLPIYRTTDFPFLLYALVLLIALEFVIFLKGFLLKRHFVREIDIVQVRTYIFEDGVEVFIHDMGEAPIEIPFCEMIDMVVYEDCIVCSVQNKSKKNRFQCICIPAFSLTYSERSKIREWYRAQSVIPKVTRSKSIKWILVVVSLFSMIVGVKIGIDIGIKMNVSDYCSEICEKESETETTYKTEVPSAIDLTDEEKLIEKINKRKIYRDRCSFYADVVSYMENVRGVTDIGNLIEPIYRTNEVYYTKEDFENEPSLIIHIAKNEIYARHGYQFKNSDLDNYFRGMVWYEPLYTAEEFDISVFNDCEQHNLKILSEMDTYEKN